MNVKTWSIVYVITLLFIVLQICLSAPAYSENEQGGLDVTIKGLQSNVGMVMISLCNNREQYEQDNSSFLKTAVKIKEGHATWHIPNLPDGEYAIKLYHDENMNGRLDTNFFGIPQEAIGFSNNVKASMGMPDYDEVKFIIQGERVRQAIKATRI